jgi:hypothetical protein
LDVPRPVIDHRAPPLSGVGSISFSAAMTAAAASSFGRAKKS